MRIILLFFHISNNLFLKVFSVKMDALVNFSDFVVFPLKCFIVFGLIPYDSGTVETRKKKLQTSSNIRDLASITETAPATGYAGLAVVKSIMIYRRKEEFNDLMETLSFLFPKSIDEQKIYKFRKYFDGYKRMERIFSVIVGSVGEIFIVVPVVKFLATGV